MEPRVEEKVGRFRILKLEDRVAPCGLGSLINNLTSSLAPCSSGGSPSIAAGLNANEAPPQTDEACSGFCL